MQHKLGYTFWLYKKGESFDTTESGGLNDVDNKLVVEMNNKEEYYHQNAPYNVRLVFNAGRFNGR